MVGCNVNMRRSRITTIDEAGAIDETSFGAGVFTNAGGSKNKAWCFVAM